MKRNTTLQPQPCMLHMENKAKSGFLCSTHRVKAIELAYVGFVLYNLEISYLNS